MHIKKSTGDSIVIHQLTLYFKVDSNFELWLLLCTNIKFKDPDALWKNSIPEKAQKEVRLRLVEEVKETNMDEIKKDVSIDREAGLSFSLNPNQTICATCHSTFWSPDFCSQLTTCKIKYVLTYYKRGKTVLLETTTIQSSRNSLVCCFQRRLRQTRGFSKSLNTTNGWIFVSNAVTLVILPSPISIHSIEMKWGLNKSLKTSNSRLKKPGRMTWRELFLVVLFYPLLENECPKS